jgi:Cof subfamily protein (haloacid dehalogenase superfamily)
MKYKLISCDFDKTLTSKLDVIPQKNIIAIKNYIEHGGIFCLNTGRSLDSLLSRLAETELKDVDLPSVCDQGGRAYINHMSKCIMANPFEHDYIINVVKLLESLPIGFILYGESGIVYGGNSKTMIYFVNLLRLKDNSLKVKKVSDYLLANPSKQIYKINIFKIAKDITYYVKKINEVFPGLHWVSDGELFSETVPSKVDKGLGHLKLCEYFNIDVKDTIAIGDSLNDLEMIEVAGLGISVGNGCKQLKEIANLVVEDSDDSAVSLVIERVLTDSI